MFLQATQQRFTMHLSLTKISCQVDYNDFITLHTDFMMLFFVGKSDTSNFV